MRKILFRGKRIDNGEWIEGFYVCLFEKVNGFYKAKHYIFDGNTKLGEERYCGHGNYEQDVKICKFEVVPETVGQYTGLTDKNGKKIFEGDIIKFCRYACDWMDKEEYDIEISVVEFECGCFVLDNTYSSDGYNELSCVYGEISHIDGTYEDCAIFEVIGNVHDNPELLGDE